jgi:hypothetical protein
VQRVLESLASAGERNAVLFGEIRAGGEGVQYA